MASVVEPTFPDASFSSSSGKHPHLAVGKEGEDAETEMKRSEPDDEASKLLRDVRERIKRHMSGEDVIPEELKDIKRPSNLGSSLEKKLRGRIKNMLSDLRYHHSMTKNVIQIFI